MLPVIYHLSWSDSDHNVAVQHIHDLTIHSKFHTPILVPWVKQNTTIQDVNTTMIVACKYGYVCKIFLHMLPYLYCWCHNIDIFTCTVLNHLMKEIGVQIRVYSETIFHFFKVLMRLLQSLKKIRNMFPEFANRTCDVTVCFCYN